jgi:hypothetical protein
MPITCLRAYQLLQLLLDNSNKDFRSFQFSSWRYPRCPMKPQKTSWAVHENCGSTPGDAAEHWDMWRVDFAILKNPWCCRTLPSNIAFSKRYRANRRHTQSAISNPRGELEPISKLKNVVSNERDRVRLADRHTQFQPNTIFFNTSNLLTCDRPPRKSILR